MPPLVSSCTRLTASPVSETNGDYAVAIMIMEHGAQARLDALTETPGPNCWNDPRQSPMSRTPDSGQSHRDPASVVVEWICGTGA